MKPLPIRPWVWTLAAAGCAAVALAAWPAAAAQHASVTAGVPLRLVADGYNTTPSFFDSVGASFKRGVDNVTSFFKPEPKVETVDDSLSMSKKPRGGPELHVAMARLYEQTNRPAEAAKAYEQALKLGRNDPNVLGAYAQYKARSGEVDDAIKYYQEALGKAPDDSALYNDLALCFARRERYPESVSHLARAIQLQPGNPLYRNNIAAVLVEMGQPDEALRHLRVVHPDAAAHYNLGFLLHKKGQSVAAAQQFAFALERDPSMTAAKYWLDRIGAHPGPNAAVTTWNAPQPPGAAAAQTALSPAAPMGVQSAPLMPLPPVGPPPEPAPLPPALATMPGPAGVAPPAYGYPDPRAQAPVVGRMPNYDAEIRRQAFEEVIDKPSRATAKRSSTADEPAPLPENKVRRLPRRSPPPALPSLDPDYESNR